MQLQRRPGATGSFTATKTPCAALPSIRASGTFQCLGESQVRAMSALWEPMRRLRTFSAHRWQSMFQASWLAWAPHVCLRLARAPASHAIRGAARRSACTLGQRVRHHERRRQADSVEVVVPFRTCGCALGAESSCLMACRRVEVDLSALGRCFGLRLRPSLCSTWMGAGSRGNRLLRPGTLESFRTCLHGAVRKVETC